MVKFARGEGGNVRPETLSVPHQRQITSAFGIKQKRRLPSTATQHQCSTHMWSSKAEFKSSYSKHCIHIDRSPDRLFSTCVALLVKFLLACNAIALLATVLATSGWSAPKASSSILIALTYRASTSLYLPCDPEAVMRDKTGERPFLSAQAQLPTFDVAIY